MFAGGPWGGTSGCMNGSSRSWRKICRSQEWVVRWQDSSSLESSCEVNHAYDGAMSPSAPAAQKPQVEDRGLAGIVARLREGRKYGFGIFHPGSWSMLIGGMMMIFSAFLPWVYVGFTQEVMGESFVLRGTDGPGVLTLSVGCLAFAGGFIPRRKLAIAHAAIPGVVVIGISLLQAYNLLIGNMQTEWGSFLPGMGLVLAAGGAVLLLRASWMMYKQWPAS